MTWLAQKFKALNHISWQHILILMSPGACHELHPNPPNRWGQQLLLHHHQHLAWASQIPNGNIQGNTETHNPWLCLRTQEGNEENKTLAFKPSNETEAAFKSLLIEWYLDKSQLESKSSNLPTGRNFSNYLIHSLSPCKKPSIISDQSSSLHMNRSFDGELILC